jgi:hypothetical protein
MFITITKNFEHLGTAYEVGQLLDVENSVGADFIQHKVAEHTKFKSSAERLAAREAERARLNPVPPATVFWAVKKGRLTDRWAVIASCSRPNCSTFYYDDDPGKITEKQGVEEGFFGVKVTRKNGSIENQHFTHSCSGTAPEKVPANICAEYRRVKKSENIPTLGADEVHYYQNCQKSKGDGERVDLYAPQTINGVVVGPPILSEHPVHPKHNNYGHENFQPNPGDGQKADLAPLNPVFKKQ